MNQIEQQQWDDFMTVFFNEQLQSAILSNPAQKDGAIIKIKIRPILLQGKLMFQSEEFTAKQVFHKNLPMTAMKMYLQSHLETNFRLLDLKSDLGTGLILVSKKGKVTIKVKKNVSSDPIHTNRALSHNRKKQYILQEGTAVPFLIDLGVMTTAGMIVRSKYDKFKQINRFLEFIEDIIPKLKKDRENVIIDFGCGKSYLTFAMYYYLKVLKEYPIRIIGLDLKEEVIDHCNQLRTKYGYDNLDFFIGDIASYEGVDQVDMVVTLHACDTATDFALAKAVAWNARIILSVPCCQHELNKQMKNPLMEPVFQYGIIKERMASLYTDALRAELLESQGYRTQLLEFISMEHTPKNILLRAVKQGGAKDNLNEIQKIIEFLQINPTLFKLLNSAR